MSKDARPATTFWLWLQWLVSREKPAEAAARESNKAIIELQKKAYSSALGHLKRAWWYAAKVKAEDEIEVDSHDSYRRLACSLENLRAGDAERAFYEFSDGIYVSPVADAIIETIGKELAAQGALLLAIEALAYCEVQPQRVETWRQQLGISEEEHERQVAERFIRWHQDRLAEDPQDAQRWVLLAEHQITIKRWDEALASAKRAVEIAPKLLDGYYAISDGFDGKQEFVQALDVLKRASQVDPEDWGPYQKMAKLYAEKLSDTTLAIESYRKAIDLQGMFSEEDEDALRNLLQKEQLWEVLAHFLQERIKKYEEASSLEVELRTMHDKNHSARLRELRDELAAVANK